MRRLRAAGRLRCDLARRLKCLAGWAGLTDTVERTNFSMIPLLSVATTL
jgi:hypothetical protein